MKWWNNLHTLTWVFVWVLLAMVTALLVDVALSRGFGYDVFFLP